MYRKLGVELVEARSDQFVYKMSVEIRLRTFEFDNLDIAWFRGNPQIPFLMS